jgi:Kef-type K+ transport system membrane component KefB
MMPDTSFANLFIVCVVAAGAPLLLGLAPRLRVPSVILEIVLGIVLGPSVLGWVSVDEPVEILSLIGLAFLLFLSGLEIDPRRLRGRLLRTAVIGYLITAAVGLPIGFGLHAAGWVKSPLLLAIALSATSLGLVVPVLKDAHKADGEVGQTAIVAATVADFSAILLLSLFFSASGGSTGSRVVLIGAFAVLVAATGLVVSRAGRSMRLGTVLLRLQDTTAEIRVRFAVVLLIAFTALAEKFGLESILGAFLAGVVISVVDRDSSSHPHFRTKLEAIGFGFLVPVFFVTSGIRLDLKGLLDNPSALARVPVFLAALLLVRGVPALLNLHSQGRAAVVATGLLQATSLPFIVTATQIGVQLGRITPVTAAALVFAGLLSVLIFPALSLSILRRAPAPAAPGTGPVHADEAPVAARYGSGLIAIGRARSTSSATTSAASTWQTRD